MYSSSPIDLSLCSWNANGLLRKYAELRIFIEKHSPDILLIQETHLRPSDNLNIANYTCHRNDRISDGPRTAGGTLILVKNSLKHYCLPTPPLRALEATNIILTPPKHDPISITCVYIPPSSDENLFTIDIEHFIQTANNCILFGDFNATHSAWNCKNLVIILLNTIDIALIKNFYYPFTINSIDDLSSDHNPVFLNFSFKLAIEPPNPRAVSTDWYAFKNNLNNNLTLFDFHPNDINNTNDLEQKISEFTDVVIETHSHASRPIETDRRNFTPQHINRLLKLKNHLRKRYHQTLNPIFKTYYNKAQSDFKKELKKYNDDIWQKRLEALNTTDNSLWRTQRFFKNKRPKIPPLNCATGTAVTDQQKSNLLATNIKNNFIENERDNDSYNHNDDIINSTINNFLSTPPTTLIEPALPDEIIHYIKHVNDKKAPAFQTKQATPTTCLNEEIVQPVSHIQIAFERCCLVKSDASCKKQKCAAQVGGDPMTVNRIWNRWVQGGNTECRTGSQRPTITSSREDRHGLNGSCSHIRPGVKNWGRLQDNKCQRTVRRRLQQHGPSARRRWLWPPLTLQRQGCVAVPK
ncbi:probable RNA-directed DNA polymerase from transposon X-element [Trichonephila clavipes]|nr:probable RNA-directed DNA polymerase from transposon X-element [Trichonephila clavipes]